MRTNIVIDDKLMADVMKVTGAKTKREAVETGLRDAAPVEAAGWYSQTARTFEVGR